MASGYLSCPACRIRVRANAPAIAVLENHCPLCGVPLTAVSSAAGVIGFRSFDLDQLSEPTSNDQVDRPGYPDELVARRKALSAQDALDAHRWEDDGGSAVGEVALKW
jgi:hypothetical protein